MFSTGLVFSPVCFLSKKHVLLESTGKWTLTAYCTQTRSPIAGCNSETKPGIFYVKNHGRCGPMGRKQQKKQLGSPNYTCSSVSSVEYL